MDMHTENKPAKFETEITLLFQGKYLRRQTNNPHRARMLLFCYVAGIAGAVGRCLRLRSRCVIRRGGSGIWILRRLFGSFRTAHWVSWRLRSASL
jgi:hypothetical protein